MARRPSLVTDSIVERLEDRADSRREISVEALAKLSGFGPDMAATLEQELGAGPWHLDDIRVFLDGVLPEDFEGLPERPPESPSTDWRYDGFRQLELAVQGASESSGLPLQPQDVRVLLAKQREKCAAASMSQEKWLELTNNSFALIESLWSFATPGFGRESAQSRSDALREELEHTAQDLVDAQAQLREAKEERTAALRKLAESQAVADEAKAALEATKAEAEEMARARQRAEDFSRELQVKLKLTEALAAQAGEARKRGTEESAPTSPRKLSVVEQASQARRLRQLEAAHAELKDLPERLVAAEERSAAAEEALQSAASRENQLQRQVEDLRAKLAARDEALGDARQGEEHREGRTQQGVAILYHRQLSALEREKELLEGKFAAVCAERDAAQRVAAALKTELSATATKENSKPKAKAPQVPRSLQGLQQLLAPPKLAPSGPEDEKHVQRLERLVRELTEEVRQRDATIADLKAAACGSTTSTCDTDASGRITIAHLMSPRHAL